ncbi:plasmid mobilization relaxosome protein MobC [Aliihoeflea sp. 40Bstr573]|uniref:plasmid mobilization protein n=1 Tax=Aliihoeflea sp. 40Bstr573 TaxID=2696467 RepID=UPI0020964A72|nr:plasmid mobilization relaxosome protein MobC [Aliihoeflea sp. 40Bstr573]MCO6389370.1 plasmid mobilization relaxosome protein MobC [Aliihoeflea sp. 40Bstr573]
MGSETRKTTQLVTIRLTPEDHAKVVAAGEARGLGPSSFARIATCKAAGLPRPEIRRKPDALSKLVGQALGEIGRMGNNVNQIARVANRTGDARAAADAEGLRQELGKLTRAILDVAR